MQLLKPYNVFNFCYSNVGRKKRYDKILLIHPNQIWMCKFTLFSEHYLNQVEHTKGTNSKENCDTFGNLEKSLEESKKQISRKTRIIKIKSRPQFQKTTKADIFGDICEKNFMWYPDILKEAKIDNDQSDDSFMIKNINRKYRDPRAYLERMKNLVEEKKLKDALNLFIEMKRNHVVPIPPHFTFMIGACGRVGYTEMAFKLLRLMTDRRIKPTSATLTGLFNSCAESPIPEYGLRKAKFLKEKVANKNWEMTQITYHAMIKAFGKCGDIQTAFQVVDEMAANDIKIDAETYNFLLMSCITNKESGFTHAIEVWRKMKQRNSIPNVFSCNLLLRAARDCDIGPEEVSSLLLQHWSNYLKRPYGFKTKEKLVEEAKLLQIESAEITIKERPFEIGGEIKSNESESCEFKEKIKNENSLKNLINKENSVIISTSAPSILTERPEGRSDIINLENIKTSSDRLALLGGAEEFLVQMKKQNIKPTIKTFTLLLECLPPYFELEEKLICLLDTHKVLPDIGFFNILMKRRIFRHENAAAKQVLLSISHWGLTPDIITYGVLATGCRHYNQALSFLYDLERLGFCPNVEIFGALLSNACVICDFKYLQHVLILMEEKDILPNEKLLIKIDKTLNTAKRNIIDMEHNKEVHYIFKQDNFPKLYKEFYSFYDSWLKRMKLEKEKDVWSQYQTEIFEKYVS